MTTPEHCSICPFLLYPDGDELSRRIIEGEHWIVTLREDQEYLGTAYVTLRDHKSSLEELTRAEDEEFITIRNQLIIAEKRAFGASVVNVSCLMNDAYRDSTPNSHVHYHFKPRYAQPVTFSDQVFVDRQFGYYIKDKHPHKVSATVGKQIVARLVSELPPQSAKPPSTQLP